MKAEITAEGCLIITAESNLESYALRMWSANHFGEGQASPDLMVVAESKVSEKLMDLHLPKGGVLPSPLFGPKYGGAASGADASDLPVHSDIIERWRSGPISAERAFSQIVPLPVPKGINTTAYVRTIRECKAGEIPESTALIRIAEILRKSAEVVE